MKKFGQTLRKKLRRYKKIDALPRKIGQDYINFAEAIRSLVRPWKMWQAAPKNIPEGRKNVHWIRKILKSHPQKFGQIPKKTRRS